MPIELQKATDTTLIGVQNTNTHKLLEDILIASGSFKKNT